MVSPCGPLGGVTDAPWEPSAMVSGFAALCEAALEAARDLVAWTSPTRLAQRRVFRTRDNLLSGPPLPVWEAATRGHPPPAEVLTCTSLVLRPPATVRDP